MIEIPEGMVLAEQLGQTVKGKQIEKVSVLQSPHKFAWFQGDPQRYPQMLEGQRVGEASSFGSHVEFQAGEVSLAVSEGATWRFHPDRQKLPAKHQLLLEFEDGSALCLTIRMYGGMLCFRTGEADNPYYLMAREKPSPLSPAFDFKRFEGLFQTEDAAKLSVKALLATEQRIPGLGNGCLQDILFHAGLHPKRKVSTLDEEDKQALFRSLKNTLQEMAVKGGRDTEPDLFGKSGGYITKCSKNTAGQPCPVCGSRIVKESYMGGSVYYCPVCQPLV